VADFTFSPPVKFIDDYYDLPNTLDKNKLKERNIVFTTPFYAKELMETIGQVDNEFIVITHNGDNEVNDKGVGYMDGKGGYTRTDEFAIPSCVIKWYATNVNTIHPIIEAIPTGLENVERRGAKNKKEQMLIMLQEPKHMHNLVYMDHSTSWNVTERRGLYNMFESKAWVTALHGATFPQFLSNLYNHKFVICPRGNGMSTHREWETLYMGSIPVQKRDKNNRFFTNLPICFVDEWEEITESFLNSEYDRISKMDWNREMLTFEYWKNKIINTL
jgi:hypothetical protein